MKNMSEIYWSKPTETLKRLRSEKFLAILKLQHQDEGFFVVHDLNVLKQQVRWIDAILTARAAQEQLL